MQAPQRPRSKWQPARAEPARGGSAQRARRREVRAGARSAVVLDILGPAALRMPWGYRLATRAKSPAQPVKT